MTKMWSTAYICSEKKFCWSFRLEAFKSSSNWKAICALVFIQEHNRLERLWCHHIEYGRQYGMWQGKWKISVWNPSIGKAIDSFGTHFFFHSYYRKVYTVHRHCIARVFSEKWKPQWDCFFFVFKLKRKLAVNK